MAILFDLDGTLLDTGPDMFKALNQLLQEENRPQVAYADFLPAISTGASGIITKFFALDVNDPANKPYLEKLKTRFLQLYTSTGFTQTKPFTGIEEVLSGIESLGLPWGIVTNKANVFAEPQLRSLGYLTRSACLVAGDTTPYVKPDPRPLHYACDLIKVDPKTCVYVGDAETDVQAGKSAGMQTIIAAFGYIPNEGSIHDWQADHIAQQPQEILSWIQKWFAQRG